ncbi:hypothetical protein [Brevundimonas sp. A19_0]|uniref:hypothetical protein n=1 Tax=Brevundimonas sp. A19_0 TaxID=2821087 RepID=UPI001ADBB603|nr:hypothetical protein [Brevundimonas sp. A19_0]MBO9501465.1 hypothetical protein [Brevundimonas sp. A19_0]
MRISGALILALMTVLPVPAAAGQDAPRCVAEPPQPPAPVDWFLLSWDGQPDLRLHVQSERFCGQVADAIKAALSGSTSRRDRRARTQGESLLARLPASGDLYLDRFGRAHHFVRSEDPTLTSAEISLVPGGSGEIYARVRYPRSYEGVRNLYATPTSSVAFFDDPSASEGMRAVTYGPETP